ncbi:MULTISPECIES: hypothetical protein [unclassified Streptomyces]|uniref:hypothetical protein n=1 Tax=unclassified Streptomyces TaxID=2593676 RepID=UPI0037FFCFEA
MNRTATPVATEPTDLRRLLVFRAHGAARLLLGCRARLEDVEGAIVAGQHETAVLMAYELVQLSLSVRGLRTEGELTYGRDEVAFDPFAGVPEDEIRAGLRLAAEGRDATGEDGTAWLARLHAHVRVTEAQLGYAEPLPDVRSGSGMLKGFKLARTWEPLLRRAALPDLLPDAWKRRAD